jgi:hypothetical protein
MPKDTSSDKEKSVNFEQRSGIFEASKIYLGGQSVNDFLPEAD